MEGCGWSLMQIAEGFDYACMRTTWRARNAFLQRSCHAACCALSSNMMSARGSDDVKPVLSLALWAFVASLAFLYVFITFRGLSSPTAMEQAQIARELARGNGFSTQMIRPAAVQQLLQEGREVSLVSMPDTYHAPLQPLLWAPVFKALERWWEFDAKSTVYRMDRVVACMGAVWLLLTLLLTHGMARRLFDTSLANFAVLALALCRPLWDMVTTGGSKALLLFLVTLACWLLLLILRRAANGEPLGVLPFFLGLAAAAMVLTHWMAVWLVLGLGVACAVLLRGHLGAIIIIVLLPILAIGGWWTRNYMECGDILGASRSLVASTLSPYPEALQSRDFDSAAQPVNLTSMIRKVNVNLSGQISDLFIHLLGVVPAALFFLALLHRFRRQDVNAMRWALALIWLGGFVGMALVGLPDKAKDDNQLHALLLPGLTVLGLAGLAVVWGRMSPGRGGVWTRHGYAWLAVIIGGWPMAMGLMSDLRVGLFYNEQLLQWPPYRPDALSLLKSMVKKDELLVSDMPWAVAWYSDRPSLWLPRNRDQFTALRDIAQKQNHHVAGFVLTPVSTQDSTLASQSTGAYGEWTELIFRGPVASLGYDLATNVVWLRDYPKGLPLGGVLMPDGRRMFVANFFADKDRWSDLKTK